MATTTLQPVKRYQDFTRAIPATLRAQIVTGRPRTALAPLVLVATVLLCCLFTIQTLMVPQVRDEHPSWHGARWIAPPDPLTGVGYFRQSITLNAMPTDSFLTIQGQQSYALYINGLLLNDTHNTVLSGITNRAQMYDIAPYLRVGANTVAVCVTNADDSGSALRAVWGLTYGQHTQLFPSNSTWRATTDASLIGMPSSLSKSPIWARPTFDDSRWSNASIAARLPAPDGVLHAPPALYETPPPAQWMVAGTGTDAFFFGRIALPSASEAWLRLAATGTASVFIDGQEILVHPPQKTVAYTRLPKGTLTLSIYDVTPYLSGGLHTIAVHVSRTINLETPVAARRLGIVSSTLPALGLDVMLVQPGGGISDIEPNQTWQASTTAAPDWTHGSGSSQWHPALLSPQTSLIAAPLQSEVLEEAPRIPAGSLLGMVLAVLLVFAMTTLLLVVLHSRVRPRRAPANIIDCVALGYLPALAASLLLLALVREPLLPRPFPFTPLWLGVLLGLVVLTQAYLLYRPPAAPYPSTGAGGAQRTGVPARSTLSSRIATPLGSIFSSPLWGIGIVVALMLVAVYMVTYQLGYEAYWQDELASIYAAKGILATGLPHFPSGYLYEKSELYSYVLAVVMWLFGDNPAATRSIAVVEYLVSLLLTYVVGRSLFGRRAGLLAMAMLVFSPMALRWGREARMYQQAQMCLLVAVYLLYRALQADAKPRYIYLSMAALVAMYLSHEETFIVFPSILLVFLLTQRLRWVGNRHWWIAGGGAILIIGLQLALVKFMRPPLVGTDHSNAPMVGFSLANLGYYVQLFFRTSALSHGTLPSLEVMSALVLCAGVIAIFKRDQALRYVCLMVFGSLGTLIFVFSLSSDRYVYPVLPLMVILAAYVVIFACEHVYHALRGVVSPPQATVVGAAIVIGVVATVLVAQIAPISNFGLASSRALQVPYHHQYPGYAAAGDYIRAHWQPGDVLVSLAPVSDVEFYAGAPDYVLYQSKALFMFERDGHLVDNYANAGILLNQRDLNNVIAHHNTVWLFATPEYACCGRADHYAISSQFVLVYQGVDTLVYRHST